MHETGYRTAWPVVAEPAWPGGRMDGQPETTKGGPDGPALVRREVVRGDYQELPLQPFVPPVQVRVYEPGEVLDFVIVNVPPELDRAEIA